MINNNVSPKKQILLDEFDKSPLTVGETISFSEILVHKWGNEQRSVTGEIKKISGDDITVIYENGRHNTELTIKSSDVRFRYLKRTVGANPFPKTIGRIMPLNYSFDSIIFLFELSGEKRRSDEYVFDGVVCHEVNWNPYIYDKDGNKQYYQRDFCWSLQDKQSFIDSIYNHISLGSVLVRKRSWKDIESMRAKGETELAFNDIVDGKQRLNTIREFLMDEFVDTYGNHFSDLSEESQNKFLNHQLLQYAEMPEGTTDEEVLYQFLKMNFSGVPQSQEHIQYVKSLLNKIN